LPEYQWFTDLDSVQRDENFVLRSGRKNLFHREKWFGPQIKYRSWKSIKDAMSNFSETDGEGCLMLSRCWGFSSGGLNVNNNNWNDNNNGVGACRKFFSLISLGGLDRLVRYGLNPPSNHFPNLLKH
jgi:hypothetical protein